MGAMTSETIEITMADGTAEAYLTRPDHGEHPAVLLYPDAIGLRPRIEEMADRIAGWGYVVLAPNIFYRSGRAAELRPDVDLSVAALREAWFATVRPRMEALTTALSRSDLDRYLSTLADLPGVAPGGVGVVGYCMGGRLSLLAAADRPDVVVAAGAFHPGGLVTDAEDSVHRRVGSVRAEVLLGHAKDDGSNPPAAIAALDQALAAAGVSSTSAVYDAVHGYSMSDTAAYDEAAAERHFRELEVLFAGTLGR
jgi:carboxymethylenebutenolidase